MTRRAIRYSLGALLAFVALNAFAGGVYAITGAQGVPTDWLEGSPFSSYVVPGFVLFVAVGGSLALAATAVFARWTIAMELAALAGSIVLVWLAVQLAIIGFVSWLQPATACVGLLILVVAYGSDRPSSAWRNS